MTLEKDGYLGKLIPGWIVSTAGILSSTVCLLPPSISLSTTISRAFRADLLLDDRGCAGKVQECGDELACLTGHGILGHHTGHDQIVIPGPDTGGNEGCDGEGAHVAVGSIQDVNTVVRPHPEGPLHTGAHPFGAD